MTLEFYGLKFSPPCWPVQGVLNHLELEYNYHNVDLQAGEHLEEEFVKMNPQHCIPMIVDGDLTLWESRAILQFLANKYDSTETLYPQDPELRARVDQKLFFDLNLNLKVREYYFAKRLNLPVCVPAKFEGLEKQFGFLEIALEGQNYLVGDQVTIADFSLVATVAICELAQFPLENYPNVAKWYEMCKETVPGILPAEEDSMDLIKALIAETVLAGEEALGQEVEPEEEAAEGEGEAEEEAAPEVEEEEAKEEE